MNGCPHCGRKEFVPRPKRIPGRLSRREAEVFSCVASGFSNKKTSETLFIHEKTVKFHVTNIYKKLGITHRGELVNGWFTQKFDPLIVEPVHAFLKTFAPAEDAPEAQPPEPEEDPLPQGA